MTARFRRTIWSAGVFGLSLSLLSAAQGLCGEVTEVQPVRVIGAAPLPGAPLDAARAPYDVQTLTEQDLRTTGAVVSGGALESRLASVSLNDNLDSPFQPDILFRGFAASPVLGTPQGLAVYQNGVRVNEAFGDAVNWDLIPDAAVARLDVVGANPVYGLNALGGAVVVTLKRGFDQDGGAAEWRGGAFGRRSVSVTLGGHGAILGGFLALKALDDDGWRNLSASRVRQVYGDVALRRGRWTLDVSYTGADNLLHGESPAPVQELAVSRRLVFTSPQSNADRLDFVTFNAGYRLSPQMQLQGQVYARRFRQAVENGNTTGDVPCQDPSQAGHLCQSDGLTPLMTAQGGAIPDLSQNGLVPIGQNDRQAQLAKTYGAALQLAFDGPVWGRANQGAAGASLDAGGVDFTSSVGLGAINSALIVQPSPYEVATPEGSPFTATPVRLHSQTTTLGLYVTDTFDVTRRLSITASGRFNQTRLALRDRLGQALTGTRTYPRFNPALGLAYRLSPEVSFYLGFAEGSRTPTASEIECSDPTRPCLLPSSLSADPPHLKQVTSRTVEAGLRGGLDGAGGHWTYSAGLYRTAVKDDIYGVATALGAGYFANIPGTLRQGGDVNLRYVRGAASVFVSYARVEATFDSPLILPSPAHPLQDASGDISVRRGDDLPGVPRNRFKAGLDWRATPRLSLGLELKAVDRQVFRGDEANRLKPLPGYGVLGLHGSWRLRGGAEAFARVENLLNHRYATFGLLGDPTGVGAPGVPISGADPRFLSPAAPVSAYLGLRTTF